MNKKTQRLLTSTTSLLIGALMAINVASAQAKPDQPSKLTPPPVVTNDDGTTTVDRPPIETGDFHQSQLVELINFDPRFHLDIRYATTNNFAGEQVYPEARAFLQKPAAEALKRVQNNLHQKGYGIIIFDAYRPWSVTKKFWDITPVEKKEFVANPAYGSRHNRGCAVDISLYDLKTSKPISMPTDYDEFTSRAYPSYTGGTKESRDNRELLRAAMEAEGFKVYKSEWWHFDFNGWENYQIMNVPFSQL